ncbi:ADP-ribose pyrophosphatase [Endozoicomonas sp. OPT23]|uniref:NUDIX hydrolase n=1 Tax=Endozoicomonas sp. OPT23 TaxID=2072845 RepID=UPI00129AEB78|nr:NUDIX hydrolase [Endozoicomonas sp. OPT23]MRI32266.1 ADP-ribose pyrophosphatase [Endozoicomonas sp. OPT23]
MNQLQWTEWAEQIRAIAQNGLTYCQEAFDIERYQQLQQLAHEMTAKLADAPLAKVDHFFLPDNGYVTPKLDVRAGVFKENKVLLVKERDDNCWSLPGGWADVCEAPARGAERETLEESGYIVETEKLVALKDTHRHPYHPRNPHHIIKMIFLCSLLDGDAKTNTEISEIDFFPIDKLPELSVGRTIQSDIELLYRHRANRALPTEFD